MCSLWAGASLAKTLVTLAASASSVFAHRLDLGAEQEMLHRHAHFLADVGGDDFIIAGQDLDVHVQAVQPLQCLRGGVLGRVEEGQETQQDQIGLILDRVNRLI